MKNRPDCFLIRRQIDDRRACFMLIFRTDSEVIPEKRRRTKHPSHHHKDTPVKGQLSRTDGLTRHRLGGGSDPTPPPRFFWNNFFIYYCIDMKLGTPLRASIWRRLV